MEHYQLTTKLDTGGELRVRFEFGDDRWTHFIERVRDESVHPILASVEGTDTDDWPASGPLQEISQHEIDGWHVLLGVGMAGNCHWSVSVRPIENGFEFDWACRVKNDETGWLGSHYKWHETGSPSARLDDSAGLVLEAGGESFSISALDDERQCQIASNSPMVQIAPANDAQPVRWAYRIKAFGDQGD